MIENESIRIVTQAITSECQPEQIILFSYKTDVNGLVASFKLVVVTTEEDVLALERRIYLTVDCDIPYDVVVYHTDEWAHLTTQRGSFADRVNRKGVVLYVKKK